MQVHSWELQLAAHGGRQGDRAAEEEDVHALLQGSREDQNPEGPSEGTVLIELGLGNPTVLAASPPLAGGTPGGPELRRSDSSRSTASRMGSKSPPRGRYVVIPIPLKELFDTLWFLWCKYACYIPQIVCTGGSAEYQEMDSRSVECVACRPSLALSVASDRQSTVSLGTSYGPGLSRMSFKPRGPGAGETQPCLRVYHQVPAPVGQVIMI